MTDDAFSLIQTIAIDAQSTLALEIENALKRTIGVTFIGHTWNATPSCTDLVFFAILITGALVHANRIAFT
jgi:hypothetical protein